MASSFGTQCTYFPLHCLGFARIILSSAVPSVPLCHYCYPMHIILSHKVQSGYVNLTSDKQSTQTASSPEPVYFFSQTQTFHRKRFLKSRFRLKFGVVLIGMFGSAQSEKANLPWNYFRSSLFQRMRSQYLNVTDRRTDRRMDDLPCHYRAVRSIAR